MSVMVPYLMKTVSGGQVRSIALGHPLLDDYLEFVAARARPNTLIAVAYDLKVFFSVIVKQPADITTADVLTFIKAQRAPRRRGIAGWRTARQWATAPQRKPPPPTTRPPPRRPDPKTPQGPSGKLDSAHPAKHGVLADVGQAPHDTARADGRSWIHLRVGGDAWGSPRTVDIEGGLPGGLAERMFTWRLQEDHSRRSTGLRPLIG